jgi:hypothetical protein
LFLLGIMVGAVALLVGKLLAAVGGTAAPGHDARRATDRFITTGHVDGYRSLGL